jgi:hypothetical protein
MLVSVFALLPGFWMCALSDITGGLIKHSSGGAPARLAFTDNSFMPTSNPASEMPRFKSKRL